MDSQKCIYHAFFLKTVRYLKSNNPTTLNEENGEEENTPQSCFLKKCKAGDIVNLQRVCGVNTGNFKLWQCTKQIRADAITQLKIYIYTTIYETGKMQNVQ